MNWYKYSQENKPFPRFFTHKGREQVWTPENALFVRYDFPTDGYGYTVDSLGREHGSYPLETALKYVQEGHWIELSKQEADYLIATKGRPEPQIPNSEFAI